MAGTLKEIASNYEKLHKIQMIRLLTKSIADYADNIVGRVEDDFDDCEDFDNEITVTLLRRINQDLETLERYL